MDHPFAGIDTPYWKHANEFFTNRSRTITISPPKPEEYTNEFLESLYLRIKEYMSMALDYILIPEFSDEGRLHFHGVMKFQSKAQLENFCCPAMMRRWKRIGMVRIDGVPRPKWIQYMFKEYEITSNMFCVFIVLYPSSYVPYNMMRLDEPEIPEWELSGVSDSESSVCSVGDNIASD